MKAVVLIKRVASLDEDVELSADRRRVDPDLIEWELNDWDRFAVEAALRARDQSGEGEVVVVTADVEDADEVLRAALAMGADRAVRVWDESLDSFDVIGTARWLAAAAEREAPDLVFAGAQSADSANAATGAAVAGHLGLRNVAVVSELEYDHVSSKAVISRELEGGLTHQMRVDGPALLTVQTGINEPRYANLRAIKQAEGKPLEVLGSDDLGLDATALSRTSGARLKELRIPGGNHADMLTGDPADLAARIASLVEEALQ